MLGVFPPLAHVPVIPSAFCLTSLATLTLSRVPQEQRHVCEPNPPPLNLIEIFRLSSADGTPKYRSFWLPPAPKFPCKTARRRARGGTLRFREGNDAIDARGPARGWVCVAVTPSASQGRLSEVRFCHIVLEEEIAIRRYCRGVRRGVLVRKGVQVMEWISKTYLLTYLLTYLFILTVKRGCSITPGLLCRAPAVTGNLPVLQGRQMEVATTTETPPQMALLRCSLEDERDVVPVAFSVV